ncbi:hypothetical protein KUTeg_005610 [Tegillarca granosa]|uniref:Uncharacterized protein n=1 Tax=Tegillarca granosa TaxID=220873 RepID=A0ABQ9FK87_TEGGR|nr:hypothetical protein KUTeg_005610 [Tegillarca granosa]
MKTTVRGTAPDKGWAWVVMVSSFGIHVINGCFLYCVGIIHIALLSKFGEPVAYTSWAGAILLCLISSTGPLSSFMMNRFNCRITIMTGGVILTLGCFISAFLPSLAWVILTYGVGSGLTYSASVVVLGFNFQKQRNIAGGVAVSGCAVGTFLFAPIITAVEEEYGYEGLFIILAGISFHQCLFGALCRPSYLENKRKLELYKQDASSVLENILIHLKLLKNGSFLFMCLSMFSWSIGVYMAFLHLPHYAETRNSTPMQASWLISAAGICGFVSRILTGVAANSENISELLLYCGSFGMLGLSTVLFPFYSFSFVGQLFYAIILGLYSGNCYAIINSINLSIVGMENLATAYGMEMFFCGIGTLLGPPFAGFIVDYGGTYEISFVVGGIAIIFGAFFAKLVVCFKHGKNMHAIKEETTLEINVNDTADKSPIENININTEQDVPLIETNDQISKRYSDGDIEEVLQQLDDHMEDKNCQKTSEADNNKSANSLMKHVKLIMNYEFDNNRQHVMRQSRVTIGTCVCSDRERDLRQKQVTLCTCTPNDKQQDPRQSRITIGTLVQNIGMYL